MSYVPQPHIAGFDVHGKSANDRILAFHVLMERRHKFTKGILTAYVDLNETFDSVHRKVVWDLCDFVGFLQGCLAD